MFNRVFAVAIDKILSLERHTVLDRNPAAQCFYTLNVPFSNCFGVIEEPVQAIERDITINFLKYVQHSADRFIVGGVQAERPAMLHQVTNHALQLIFHPLRQIRTWLKEVFKIRCRKDQHFPRPVGTIEVGSLPWLEHIGPAFKVFQFLLRTLGKQIVGNTYRHLFVSV